MNKRRSYSIIGLAAVALLMAGLACSALGGPSTEPTATPRATRTPQDEDPTEEAEPTEEEEPTEEAEPTEEEEPTEEVSGGVLLEDDFSDPGSGWSEADSEAGSREYRDGQYVVEITDTGWFIWVNPGAGNLSNTHTTVTITNAGEAEDPTFGVMCNYQDEVGYYYMGIGPDGYYAIVRTDGEDDTFLTSDENLWIQSEDIELNADAYVLEALCASDGTLTLIVNGVEIDSVQDDTYTEGDTGLFAQSFEQVPVEVRYDDLSIVAIE